MGFPKEFVWGAATSAYQIEGAVGEDGRGLTVWDDFCTRPKAVLDGSDGSVACDHYHRSREDVALMRELGLQAYRFSVAWARLLPEGTGRVNEPGIAFYSQLVDRLLENGITPYVTLFHWDLPYALYQRGGWMNPDSPKWFAEYAGLAARRLGDRVKHFITFNEPQCFVGSGQATGYHAPGTAETDRSLLQIAHNVLLAHGLAVQAIRAAAPGALVGYAPTGSPACPLTSSPEDVEAARAAYFAAPQSVGKLVFSVSWWSDPVLLGRYPEDGLAANRAGMPEIGADDMKTIAQPLDFYCQNIYNGSTVRSDGRGGYEEVPRPFGSPATASGWPITPECLYWGPKFLYERYGLPIVISESGISCRDTISSDGGVHDPGRIDFLRRYLRELRRAVEDGVPVEAYFLWSLLDNFEWSLGYTERFGIVHVDYATQKRTVKDSALWYRECIRANGENL